MENKNSHTKDRVSELLKEIHEELNARGEYNIYLITENADTGALKPIQCYSYKALLNEEEEKAFVRKAEQMVKQLETKANWLLLEEERSNHSNITKQDTQSNQ